MYLHSQIHTPTYTRIQAAGFDPSLLTVWTWEGVINYLTVEAISITLKYAGCNAVCRLMHPQPPLPHPHHTHAHVHTRMYICIYVCMYALHPGS